MIEDKKFIKEQTLKVKNIMNTTKHDYNDRVNHNNIIIKSVTSFFVECLEKQIQSPDLFDHEDVEVEIAFIPITSSGSIVDSVSSNCLETFYYYDNAHEVNPFNDVIDLLEKIGIYADWDASLEHCKVYGTKFGRIIIRMPTSRLK